MLTDAERLVVWMPALPALGFVVNGLFGRRFSPRVIGAIGVGSVAAAFGCALFGFVALSGDGPGTPEVIASTLYSWMSAGTFSVNVGFYLDPLSSLMTLVITGVGLIIHVYSLGYLKGDSGYARYFAYLNLFTAAMLLLVLADNLVLMFVGWEGVGLCSYLLIGFWFTKEAKAKAGMKAFVVNRIGDLGFLVGMFWLFQETGTLNFAELPDAVRAAAAAGVLSAGGIGLALFVGATGKSAQLPLFTWLPDAMAGPTPVSALIHAATMVTAGVYLICRMSALYGASIAVSGFICLIGAATALLGALAACTQRDIKKVLAYSTISQLGYMFMAVGAGAYTAAMFHLTTHAFFKALLFLAAGSVIHAMHHAYPGKDEAYVQDLFHMGGLRERLRTTYVTFIAGAAALAGLVPLSGFFSKDGILHELSEAPKYVESGAFVYTIAWLIGLLAAVLTAFYITRCVLLAFHGRFAGSDDRYPRVVESPGVMRVALVVLAVLSILGGFLNAPADELLGQFLGLPRAAFNALTPEQADAASADLLFGMPAGVVHAMLLSTVLVLLGIGLAWFLYTKKRSALASFTAGRGARTHALMTRAFGIDAAYNAVARIIHRVAGALYVIVDRLLIDFAIQLAGLAMLGAGTAARRWQSGRLNAYALSFLVGVIALLGYLLARYV